ncbi:MAG: CRISPR-associated endonuclease Cas2 [Oceanospirillaceae bacterium]|nr:CRISPR-associated endonuclease Cas2 [Oceanospirillaceae bacterium]|tara:strand:+ start:251 stop:607 length:357 start_codon:yes stop_codon:yes gene_type:complete
MRDYWYLIQYDIANPKRLQRVYRLLKSCAIPLQHSVFAWQGNQHQLAELKRQLTQRINLDEDDIRGYRIRKPIYLFGRNPLPDDLAFDGGPPHRHCPISALQHAPEALWSTPPQSAHT